MRALPPLLMLVLVAGCVEVPAGAPDAEGALRREAFFTSDMALAPAPPSEGAVRAGGFFRAWAEGQDYPTWLAPPQEADALVERVRVALAVRATGPVAETARFPDIMVYAGDGEAWTGFGQAQTPSVLVPGVTYRLDVEVEVPQGGLWVPTGASFGVKVVPVMLQEDAADVEVLVGPHGSRAAWDARAWPGAPQVGARSHAQGALAGSAYAGEAAPESTSARTWVEVPAGAGALVAWMNVTAHEGVPDVDLAIEAPDGSVVASAGTPTPREAIKLAAPNLAGPGEYALVVTSYGSARAQFELTWAVGGASSR